eukprot:PhM_4_TR9985/c0_g1_i1/m.98945
MTSVPRATRWAVTLKCPSHGAARAPPEAFRTLCRSMGTSHEPEAAAVVRAHRASVTASDATTKTALKTTSFTRTDRHLARLVETLLHHSPALHAIGPALPCLVEPFALTFGANLCLGLEAALLYLHNTVGEDTLVDYVAHVGSCGALGVVPRAWRRRGARRQQLSADVDSDADDAPHDDDDDDGMFESIMWTLVGLAWPSAYVGVHRASWLELRCHVVESCDFHRDLLRATAQRVWLNECAPRLRRCGASQAKREATVRHFYDRLAYRWDGAMRKERERLLVGRAPPTTFSASASYAHQRPRTVVLREDHYPSLFLLPREDSQDGPLGHDHIVGPALRMHEACEALRRIYRHRKTHQSMGTIIGKIERDVVAGLQTPKVALPNHQHDTEARKQEPAAQQSYNTSTAVHEELSAFSSSRATMHSSSVTPAPQPAYVRPNGDGGNNVPQASSRVVVPIFQTSLRRPNEHSIKTQSCVGSDTSAVRAPVSDRARPRDVLDNVSDVDVEDNLGARLLSEEIRRQTLLSRDQTTNDSTAEDLRGPSIFNDTQVAAPHQPQHTSSLSHTAMNTEPATTTHIDVGTETTASLKSSTPSPPSSAVSTISSGARHSTATSTFLSPILLKAALAAQHTARRLHHYGGGRDAHHTMDGALASRGTADTSVTDVSLSSMSDGASTPVARVL